MNRTLYSTAFAVGALCCTITGRAQEIYTQDNAASIIQESNSTTGWITNGTLLTPDTTSPYDGTYAIRAEASSTSSNGRRFRYIFNATIGETYNISIWAKQGSQGTSQSFAAWTGVSGFTNPTKITSASWTEYNFVVTATNTNPTIIIYTGSSVQGAVGDVVFIDRISITPQSSLDTQAPTSPILSSSDYSDTTADLSWSDAIDNTGVTGYKIFKDGVLESTLGNVGTYQVTGLTAGTSYSFTLTALDAVGNESMTSNVVTVTTDSSGTGDSGGAVWSEVGSVASYTGDVGVGTGTVPSGYSLAVNGKIIAEEVKVQLQAQWPDYVFEKEYQLASLDELEKFIGEKGHLPNMPSANEVEANGIQVGEMNRLLLEKIEELTLYIMEQNVRSKQTKRDLVQRIEKLETIIYNNNSPSHEK